ncbi:MAG: hypothetical protein H6725_19595 [Sandaracinaceae bacterium]|nr:hypothetical protein [Sandaracinaceae bacterium]
MIASDKNAWRRLAQGYATAAAAADRVRKPVPPGEALARLVTLQRMARERGTELPTEAQRRENLEFHLRWHALRQRLSDD